MLLPEEKKTNSLLMSEEIAIQQSFELCHHQKGKQEICEAVFAEQG